MEAIANKENKEKKRKEQYSSLSIYFSEVDGGKLLTKQQEIQLAKSMDMARYRDKDGKTSDEKLWKDENDENFDVKALYKAKKAREKLISSNLRLVASVAKNFQGKGCEFEDLIQEGNIGLMDGIDRFDWTRNLKISTYCCWWIRQRIDRLIANHGRTVRVPVHVQNLASKLRNMVEKFNEDFDCNPTVEEISESLDCSTDMAKAALLSVISPTNVAIDHAASSEGDDNLHSYIEDENSINPLDILSHKELVRSIRKIIKDLPPRDEKIIRLRFGITEDPKDFESWRITEKELMDLEARKNGK